jgi:aspartate 1-decarboxylase
MAGESGSGKIELNGAAARLAHPGDLVIVMAYNMVAETDLSDWQPTIVLVNEQNQVKEILC